MFLCLQLTALCGRIIGRQIGHHAIQMTNTGTRQIFVLMAKTGAATMVILPGFTEFCEKYSRDILRLHQSGFNVLVIDWPGQGLSGHFGKNPLAVHCDDFAVYLAALDAVIEAAGLGEDRLFLFGHSMGGHLALRYAARRPRHSLGVILTAPMMAPPVMPIWLIRGLSALLLKAGLGVPIPHFTGCQRWTACASSGQTTS